MTNAPQTPQSASKKRFEDLPPTAQRALKEADARRSAAETETLATEHKGRKGPEPTRYGDWEKSGVCVDF